MAKDIGNSKTIITLPLISKNKEELLSAAKKAKDLECDLLEWRADYFTENENKDKEFYINEIKENSNKEVLFTMRTEFHGGKAKIGRDVYYSILDCVIEHSSTDYIDIEFDFNLENQIEEDKLKKKFKSNIKLIEKAKHKGIKVVGSYHNFELTPTVEKMVQILSIIQNLGVEIPKIAVMPESKEDVLKLLEAARIMRENYAKTPFVAISMGELGLESRVMGGEYGTAISFARPINATEKEFPGNIDLEKLIELIEAQ
ncbi:MAG: type I 3-dehydroquinate dehydratase [Anaerovoracaceae bacterium]